MDFDWNDGAIIISVLLAVLISWWGPITRGSTAELWALSLVDSQGTESGDHALDLIYRSSEATLVPQVTPDPAVTPHSVEIDGFDFSEIFNVF